MNVRAVHVAFGNHTVAVESDSVEVIQQIRGYFHNLIGEAQLELARFHIKRLAKTWQLDRRHLHTAMEGSYETVVSALKEELLLTMMAARADLVWLHAGAAAFAGHSVLTVARSCQGKSTLIIGLCERGWQFLGDDILPLRPQSQSLFPFPLTPAVRRSPKPRMLDSEMASMPKVAFQPADVARSPFAVAAIVLPSYNADCSARLLPCSPALAAAEMLQQCLNFPASRDKAVQACCELIRNVPSYRLPFHQPDAAIELLAQLLQHSTVKAQATCQVTAPSRFDIDASMCDDPLC